MIRIALRFDDPSATSDKALEERILDAARAAGIPLTVAVIPYRRIDGELCPLSRPRSAHLAAAQSEGLIEIAQHGYCHESDRGKDVTPPSEFMEVEAGLQGFRISAGRSLLNEVFGRAPEGFVPPWNTFDATTTLLLKQSGFSYLSAGWDLSVDCSTELSYLPRTCQVMGMVGIVESLRPYASFMPAVIGVIHHYDFVESGNPKAVTDMAGFTAHLLKLARMPYGQPITLAQLACDPVGASHARHKQNAWTKLPWKLRTRLPQNALVEQSWPKLSLHSLFYTS